MKTTVIKLEGIQSVLAPTGVEKHMCAHPGIHKVETNYMTGTATVYHDDSVTLAEIKSCVTECGYQCTGESLPERLVKPGDPPAGMAHPGHEMVMDHSGHDMAMHAGPSMPAKIEEHAGHTGAAKADEHAGHIMPAEGGKVSGEMAQTAQPPQGLECLGDRDRLHYNQVGS